MRVKISLLGELTATVLSARVALTVDLKHVATELGLLLEVVFQALLRCALRALQFTLLMSSCNMLA